MLDMGAVPTVSAAAIAKGAQPSYNTSSSHEISDLHLMCSKPRDKPGPVVQGLKTGGAGYGIWAPGVTGTLFSRIHVNLAGISGARLFYCWINRFDNVNCTCI